MAYLHATLVTLAVSVFSLSKGLQAHSFLSTRPLMGTLMGTQQGAPGEHDAK